MDADVEGGGQREDRPRGVPKARLEDIKLQPTINIFFKSDRYAINMPLVSAFPKEAATLFCSKIFKHASNNEKNGDKTFSYTIVGGDKTAYQSIFAWIKDCVDQKSILKFPDIPEPDHDPFTPTVDIIEAGNVLEIPAGSLSFFLEKRLTFIARKHMMPLSQVEECYTVGSRLYELGLTPIAKASIFNAWWDCRIDQSVTPDLMEQLYDLREAFPDLDQDLHDAFDEKKAAVEKSWMEKKLKRQAEQEQAKYDNSAGDLAQCGTEGPGGDMGWDNSNTITAGGCAATPVVEAWEKENVHANTDFSSWDKPDVKPAGDKWDDDNNAGGRGDWADEVNEQQAQPAFAADPGSGR